MQKAKDKPPNLGIELAGISLKNPVMVASGTFGYGEEYAELVDLNRLGAIVAKTITLKPRLGNEPPRIVETASGVLNSIGLQNVGIDAFINEKLPFFREYDVPLIVSIAGDTIDEYVQLAKTLKGEEISGLELNLSCPNIKYGRKFMFAQDPKTTHQVVSRVRKATSLPLMVKLSPNVTDISSIARVCEEAGADGVSLINTFTGMAIDIESRKPILRQITGGLSGPAIKPIALRMVYEVHRAVKIPIIGIGGIMTAGDALEFIIAGAEAVAIGTGNFVDPLTPIKVIDGIREYMIRNKIKDIKSMVGSLQCRKS
ncbi:dihydroorotate dehydrogenase [bacterium]|nr:dihydroorotate dehydrogenase [bacterium]NIN92830.1 dihydroorotate dehydrogenase [bacterium]NIO18785.1 dihydroorotate dehydrogenase [bacterium]NIO73866.1 dihydroorotate dehydrogenase [bacterium]